MNDAIREAFDLGKRFAAAYGAVDEAGMDRIEKEFSTLQSQTALSANGGEATPYGYLREVDGRVQLSVGPECPPNRSGGMATPWQAIFDPPAPPSVAVPEGWDDDAAKQLEQARQLQEAQYGSSAQTLTAAPSPDHIADAGKVVPENEIKARAISAGYDKGYREGIIYARVCCARLDNPENTKEYRDCARFLDLVFAGAVDEAARLRTAGDEGEEV